MLYQLCAINPFTHAVELIRFALYERFNVEAAVYTLVTLCVLLTLAIYGYNPVRGMMSRKDAAG